MRTSLLFSLCFFAWSVVLATGAAGRAEEKTGEQIYKQQCARCHGPAGEGTKKYPQPLTGDRSVAGLAAVIARTMPENDPGTCVGDDAKRVSTYIHDAFYSPVAQARKNPPRIAFSHLTVRQYRNAVADLIGSFRHAAETRRPPRTAWRILQRSRLPGQQATHRPPRPRSAIRLWHRRSAHGEGQREVRSAPVLHPLGRLGACSGNGRLRIHRPDRARHTSLGQR